MGWRPDVALFDYLQVERKLFWKAGWQSYKKYILRCCMLILIVYSSVLWHNYTCYTLKAICLRFIILLVHCTVYWAQLGWDYPLNLSILIRGGKESNHDFLINGEWTGKSPTWKSNWLNTDLSCSVTTHFLDCNR